MFVTPVQFIAQAFGITKNYHRILFCFSVLVFVFLFLIAACPANASIGDGVFIYDQTTPSTNVQQNLWLKSSIEVGTQSSPFAGSGTSKHVQVKGAISRKELLLGIQDSAGTLTIYKSNDEGQSWTSQWSATVGDGNLKRFDISYEQTSGDALVVYSSNAGTTNEILYQTWNGSDWSGAQNHDNIRTSGTVYGIKGAERNGSNEIGIVWVDTNLNMSADLWTGSSWYGEPSASLCSSALCTIARTGGASPSSVPTHRGYDLAFESSSGDLMVVWGNDSLSTTQTDPRYLMKTAGGAWGAAAGTAIANLTEDGEMLDISPSPVSDRIALTTCSLDSGSDCNFIVWSGSSWGTVASDTTSGTMIAGESSNNTEWLVDGANEVAIMTYGDAAAAGIDWYTSTNGGTPAAKTDETAAPIMGAVAERAGFSKAFPNDPTKALFIFEDNNSDVWVKVARLRGTLVSWYSPAGVSAAIETNASVVGFNPVGFGFLRYTAPPVSGVTISGTVYESDGVTPDTTGYMLNISKNGETAVTTISNGSGVFSFNDFDELVEGDVLTIWTTGGGATSVLRYGSGCTGNPDCTDIPLVRDSLILKTFDGSSFTNSTLSVCDADAGAGCSSVDIGIDSDGTALTVDDGYSVVVDSGTNFVPGGSVTAKNLNIIGTVTSVSETIFLKGDFNNSGNFTIGSGTISFIDSAFTSNVYGSNTFYNLTVAIAGKNVNFESGTTTTINGSLNIAGDSGAPVVLNSTSGSSTWTINFQGSSDISYLSVAWSACDPLSNTLILDITSNNGGHNGNCWRFKFRGSGGGSSGSGPGTYDAGQGGGGAGGSGSPSSGPRNPGTVVNNTDVGQIAFSNPSDAITSNDVEAFASNIVGVNFTNYLKATNFGFTIPSEVTITGILVEVERRAGHDDSDYLTDSNAKIVKSNGSIGSTNRADLVTHWTTSTNVYKSYGGSADLWGETWAPSDINDPDFGFVINAQNPGDNFGTVARIDHIRITVYYSSPGGGDEGAGSGGSGGGGGGAGGGGGGSP